MVIQISDSLHKKLKLMAVLSGMSIARLAEQAIKKEVDRMESERGVEGEL